MMERILQTPIKELIDRFPPVGTILEEAGIGCVPCSVGTCLVGDIVEIHGLDTEGEEDLLSRIAAVVSPGESARPGVKRTRPAKPRTITYSPPVKDLVEEHKVIKRFVALVPEIVGNADVESEEGRHLIGRGIDFIRSYADRFHHAKEEEILFSYFDERLEILQAMHDDHRRARARVRDALESLERRDRDGVAAGLAGYAGILTEHIRKEDEILYPWMDRNLSTRQIGEMFARFRAVDETFRDERRKQEEFVSHLEAKLLSGSAEVMR